MRVPLPFTIARRKGSRQPRRYPSSKNLRSSSWRGKLRRICRRVLQLEQPNDLVSAFGHSFDFFHESTKTNPARFRQF